MNLHDSEFKWMRMGWCCVQDEQKYQGCRCSLWCGRRFEWVWWVCAGADGELSLESPVFSLEKIFSQKPCAPFSVWMFRPPKKLYLSEKIIPISLARSVKRCILEAELMERQVNASVSPLRNWLQQRSAVWWCASCVYHLGCIGYFSFSCKK